MPFAQLLSRRSSGFTAVVVLSLALSAGCTAQPNPTPKRLTAAQWHADIDALRTAVAQRHPRYADGPLSLELESAFARASASIEAPMTPAEGFRILGRINPAFEDAHTLLMPLPDEANVLRHDPGRLFPFTIRVRDGRLFVDGAMRRSADGAEVADGAELLAINGMPSAELLEKLTAYGHGETPVLRQHMLRVMFESWLFAVLGWQDQFSIVLVDGDSSRRTVETVRGDHWEPVVTGAAAETPRARFLPDGTAYLRLPTFDVDEAPEAFARAVDKAFAEIRTNGASRLVLDVRGNTGGQSDSGAAVLRYLIDRPIVQVASARERLHAGNNGLFGYKGKPGEVVTMDLNDEAQIQPVAADERFRGRVAVLMDSLTYSAGILFVTSIRDHRLGILVGQPTGGFANQTGNMEPFHLPNSGLMAYIPARVFVRPSGDARLESLAPDVLVEAPATFADHDAVIAAAVAHLADATTGMAAAPKPSRSRFLARGASLGCWRALKTDHLCSLKIDRDGGRGSAPSTWSECSPERGVSDQGACSVTSFPARSFACSRCLIRALA